MAVRDVAAGAGIAPARLTRIERGTADLGYLEGGRLAKSLDLCPNCFRRCLEAAAERDLLAAESAEASRDATADPTTGAVADRPLHRSV